MTKQSFKVGDVVRLTITDKDAECGQWFETTVTGVSSKCGVLLNLEGFIVIFSTDEGDGYGDRRIIDKGARFELGIQKFCFYSSDDIQEKSDMEWTEFKATLELVAPEVPTALGCIGIENHKTPLDILHDAANEFNRESGGLITLSIEQCSGYVNIWALNSLRDRSWLFSINGPLDEFGVSLLRSKWLASPSVFSEQLAAKLNSGEVRALISNLLLLIPESDRALSKV